MGITLMTFDVLLLTYCFIYLRNLSTFYFDAWVKLFGLMVLFQFIHNIWFSGDILYSIKELFQGVELIIFYLILRLFLSDQSVFNKTIEYTFNGLSFLALLVLLKYFFPSLPTIVDTGFEGLEMSKFNSYLKPSSVINMVIPIFILSFFYFNNPNCNTHKKFLVFIISISACYVGIVSNSRVFQLLLILIFLDLLFSKRKILKITVLFLVFSFLAVFYQDNILSKYNLDYKEKIDQSYNYITNDEPFTYYGYNQLMVISDPSNRERIHFLKASYQTASTNPFFGIGAKFLENMSNLHGIIFIYAAAFGTINMVFLLYLIMILFSKAKKILKASFSPSDRMQYYYFLYAFICLIFVSAGNFPMLPLIISAAMINSTKKLKIPGFNNNYGENLSTSYKK